MNPTRFQLVRWMAGGGLAAVALSPLPASAQSMDQFLGQSPSLPASPPIQPTTGLPSNSGGGAWSADYRLGAGDVIEINVFEAEEYSGEFLVLQDGTVNLPRVERVPVQGLTFQEAANQIASRYAIYIRRPLITITPVRLRPVRIAISGEVKRPGAYNIEATSGSNRDNNNQESRFPTLTQAIAEAGGITGSANIREVEVRRPTGPSRKEVTYVNLWDLIQSGDLGQDLILQSGDEVVVPTAVALSPAEATTLSNTSIAPESIQIYIAGEVDSPGAVAVPLNTTLNQAILAAGNFNPRANRATVELVRVNPDGTATQRRIPVDFSLGVNDENNPTLQDQDVVVVKRSTLARVGDVADVLLSPVTRILNSVLGFQRLFD